MAQARRSSTQIVRLGKQLYERSLRRHVERKHHGKFMAIDVETGNHEIDEDQVAVCERLRDRNPDATIFLLRIGYPAAVKLGLRLRVTSR